MVETSFCSWRLCWPPIWRLLRLLWPIIALFAFVAGELVFSPDNAGIILSLLIFAYVQSIAFALTSRSRNRSSVVYHFIAVTLSAVVFFWMLERLIAHELTLMLLVPYIAGTVSGSVSGAQISTWIEKKIGAIADMTSGSPFTQRSFIKQAWPIFILLAVLVFHIASQPPRLAWEFSALAALLFAQNFSHTIVSRAGNRNKPTFILGSVLFNGVIQFVILQRLVSYDMDWSLLVPYAVGSVSGSISGALISMRIEHRIGASTDAHVRAAKAPQLVLWPIGALFLFVLIESLLIRQIAFLLLTIYGLALAQNFSFMLVSRARNRNNILYHALASVFSNGVWFLTFRELYVTGLEWSFVVPYMGGVASGSLLAYNVSIWIERRIGAVADTSK